MLLQDARREARLDAAGDMVMLEEQDRSLWNRAQIAEALPLVEEAFARRCRSAGHSGGDLRGALPGGARGGYGLAQILRLYDLLERAAAIAGGALESRGGGGDGARSAGRAGADR